MLAATHSKGTTSCSKLEGSRSVRWRRNGSLEWTWVRLRARVDRRPSSEPPNVSSDAIPRQTAPNDSTCSSVGSAAITAPLIAPTELPNTRSGLTPASSRAPNIPTSAAPSIPPPPRTNAVCGSGGRTISFAKPTARRHDHRPDLLARSRSEAYAHRVSRGEQATRPTSRSPRRSSTIS